MVCYAMVWYVILSYVQLWYVLSYFRFNMLTLILLAMAKIGGMRHFLKAVWQLQAGFFQALV